MPAILIPLAAERGGNELMVERAGLAGTGWLAPHGWHHMAGTTWLAPHGFVRRGWAANLEEDSHNGKGNISGCHQSAIRGNQDEFRASSAAVG
jgi:hypothetical protein